MPAEEFTAEEREAAKKRAEKCAKPAREGGYQCQCCPYTLRALAALEAAEAERNHAIRWSSAAEEVLGSLTWELDQIADHFNSDGTIKGDGKWRLREIGLCVQRMQEAERKGNFDKLEEVKSLAQQNATLQQRLDEQERYARLGRLLMASAEALVASGNSPEDPRDEVVDGYIAGYEKVMAERDQLKLENQFLNDRVHELESRYDTTAISEQADRVRIALADPDGPWHHYSSDLVALVSDLADSAESIEVQQGAAMAELKTAYFCLGRAEEWEAGEKRTPLDSLITEVASELSEVEAERDRLKAIVEKLPKCGTLVDGVVVLEKSVTFGMTLWTRLPSGRLCDFEVYWISAEHCGDSDRIHMRHEECFDSREAAEKAKEGPITKLHGEGV